ncbi:disintegrin and metalloproteinase domain-containing protein 17-like [Watersipora subatra]|uniref:disintegrin and metalloproteinase domain-containing protein 17-like n=1 Tax=Watersipora subatra TaxID=2589382 RepID=UPI00355C9CDE
MVHSANEAGAVKYLLMIKEPMAADVTVHSNLKSQMREFKTAGKINEQFEGELKATVDQLMQLTVIDRAKLGITEPTKAEQVDMLLQHQKLFIRKTMTVKHPQKKRALGEVKYCNLHIIVDGYFTHYMANGNKLEAAKMLTQSVKNAHEIFVSSDFDGNLLPDNIGVVLAGLTFIEKIAGFDYLKSVNDPVPFLNHFTQNYRQQVARQVTLQNLPGLNDLCPRQMHLTSKAYGSMKLRFPGVCTAMAFTFQDFGPTLGMAWVAQSSRPARTGIGAPKNHGFVTTLLQGKRVPARMIHLTLVHELGHSFGSVHDPTEPGHQCAPSDAQGGKYIMYPTSSAGTMPNNFIFSPCSKNVIALDYKDGTHGRH